jgi:arylsulfatase
MMDGNKPHILLITADELRKDSFSCYGNKAIHTPNIDALANKGILFDKAYTVSPWCLPARCSILTGLFPHNSGAYSNFRKCALDNGIPNLFTQLKKADYTTSLFGKCHFAPVPYDDVLPDKTLEDEEFKKYYMSLGIDELQLQDDKNVSAWFYDDYSRELEKAGYLKSYRDKIWELDNSSVFPFPAPSRWHPDAWVGRKTVEFLESYNMDKPLFSWVSFSGPHYPFDAPKEYIDKVDEEKIVEMVFLEDEFNDPDRIHHSSYFGEGTIDACWRVKDRACKNFSKEYWRRLRKSYLANVALIDEQIGRIISTARSKFGDNILIIFTADHGEMLGNHRIWGKGNCGYEDVWNIPMIVKYPGKVSGIRTDAKVMLTDILPTCLKAAQAEEIHCDGVDFEENIKTGGYDYVYAEGDGFIAASDGKTKYIHIQQKDREFRELIDLSDDPNEFINQINNPLYYEKQVKLQAQVLNLLMKKLLP